MLAGETPFKGEHEAALLYEIVHEEPETISEKCADIDPYLCEVIERALKKDPAERYHNAGQMKNDLKNFQASSTGRVATRTSLRAGGGSVRRNIWIGIASVAVIAVAIGYVVKTGREPAPLTAAEMSLAVVDFRDMTASGDSLLSPMLTELLTTSLIESCPIRVKSPEHLRDIRRRKYGSGSSRVEEGQELEIASESGATYALTGSISIGGDEGFVTWRLIDLRSREGIAAGRIEPGAISAIVDEIVSAVLPKITGSSAIEHPPEHVPIDQLTTSSATAYEYYFKGKMKVDQYRREEALRDFETAVSIDSTFALAYFEMAKLFFGSANIRVNIVSSRRYAAAAWRHEEKLGSMSRLHLKALQHGLDYEVTAEMTTLREMLEKWPNDRKTIRIMQGRAYWWWYFEEAAKASFQGMALYPDDPVFGGPTGISALRNLGRYTESMDAARSYVEKFPKEHNGWDELALSYISLGNPDSAVICFRKAVSLEPDWAPENFAYLAYSAGDLEKAISIFHEILERKDISDEYRLRLMCHVTHSINLPALYFEAGRFSDAVRVMNDAKQFTGDDPSNWQYQAGYLFAHVGLPEKAIEIAAEMERSEEILVRIFAYRFKGIAQIATGDLEGAAATAAKTHELAKSIGPILNYCAHQIDCELALSEDDISSAYMAVEEMRNTGVSSGMLGIESYSLLAEVHYATGDFEKAVVVHNELLHIYGGHALSHYELGMLYEELKRPKDAKKHYEKFLEMWKNADDGLPQPVDARRRLASLTSD